VIATQSAKMKGLLFDTTKDDALRRNYYGEEACNRVGITPYYGSQGLCSQVPAKKYDNNNLRAYLKGVVESDRSGTRNNTRGPYRIHDSQLYTAELVEERGKFEASMISVNVVKSKSDLINGGSKKTNNKSRPCFLHAIPHLITALVVEFIFDKELKLSSPPSEVPNKSNQSIDKLKSQLVEANEARVVAEKERVKAEDEKKQAQQKEAMANDVKIKAKHEAASALAEQLKAEQDTRQAKKAVEEARVAAAEEARVAAAAAEEARVAAAAAEEARVAAVEEARVAAADAAEVERVAEEKRIELEIIIEDNKTDMEAKEEENIELHDQVQQSEESKDFSRSVKAKLCAKQNLQIKCILCDCKFVILDFHYCHIVSKNNGGMGTETNGLFACRYCNSGQNPYTYETGMREANLMPWLRKTYPGRAEEVRQELIDLGKDVGE
jgi:hypothetical protein